MPDVDRETDPATISIPVYIFNQRTPILRNIKLAVILAIVLIPAVLHAAFDVERILTAEIGAPILDVTTNPAGDLVFVLTPGEILIYSTDDQAVLDRIPIKKPFDRIAYQDQDRLVLTAAKPSRINVIRFSRLYEIELSGRVINGPADAKVTLVVFDDYQ